MKHLDPHIDYFFSEAREIEPCISISELESQLFGLTAGGVAEISGAKRSIISSKGALILLIISVLGLGIWYAISSMSNEASVSSEASASPKGIETRYTLPPPQKTTPALLIKDDAEMDEGFEKPAIATAAIDAKPKIEPVKPLEASYEEETPLETALVGTIADDRVDPIPKSYGYRVDTGKHKVVEQVTGTGLVITMQDSNEDLDASFNELSKIGINGSYSSVKRRGGNITKIKIRLRTKSGENSEYNSHSEMSVSAKKGIKNIYITWNTDEKGMVSNVACKVLDSGLRGMMETN